MAVYTDVAAEDLAEFLKGYDIGELLSYKGIAEGVENSNFLVHTSKGAYILTLYEKRVAADDLPYFLSLMAHLAERGVRCPQPATQSQGRGLCDARRAAGGDHQFPRRHVAAAAERDALRRRRRGAGEDASGGARFPACPQEPAVGRPAGGRCSIRPRARADSVQAGLRDFIARELDHLEARWPKRSAGRRHPCRPVSGQRVLPRRPAVGADRLPVLLQRHPRL